MRLSERVDCFLSVSSSVVSGASLAWSSARDRWVEAKSARRRERASPGEDVESSCLPRGELLPRRGVLGLAALAGTGEEGRAEGTCAARASAAAVRSASLVSVKIC